MRRERGRVVEVTSAAELEHRLDLGARGLGGWRVVGVDLTRRADLGQRLAGLPVGGALFLGCTLPDELADRLRIGGAVVLPQVPVAPVDPARTTLYTAAELYDTPAYADSLDARVYAWSRQPSGRDGSLVEALHDHAIDEALASWTAHRRLVGVMGGHGVRRGDPDYRDAARLGLGLAGSATVATGGGPGAMEAANLGAWLTDEAQLDPALTLLAQAPTFHPDVGAWARAAFAVRERWPEGRASLGVPTWYYGHEPPNVFATAIAKYFANATREAVLLSLCDAGIVFLPGAGGTVQEVFQDACENYYADASSVAPMILVGRRYWTEELPAWPLLLKLSRGRPMEGHVHLAGDVEEAVALVAERPRTDPGTQSASGSR